MSTTNDKAIAVNTPALASETPTQHLDRLVHAAIAPVSGGLSPVALALATVDWAWHLGVSPGRQLELTALAWRLGQDTLQHDASPDDASHPDDDPRFRHEAWANWPFSQIRTGFRNTETFWREAATVPGMTAHHAHMTQFFAKQWLGMLAPANWLPTNPVVLQDVAESNGAHLLKGLQNWFSDVSGVPAPEADAPAQQYLVGRDVAITPGKVVFRNHLIELLRYEAQTDKVHPEPVLIVPSWIMKYYILDLSPHNSLVRYLVEQGHTVYMLSWRNPDASDHDLTMDDYLRLGIIDALHTVGELSGMQHGVHAMGYCLGGTLMAIAATLGRRGGMSDYARMPEIATLSLLAAQTDFSQPGELGLFIDESQLAFLEDVTRAKGYLTGKQMAGSFQFLHSRDLVWTRRMNEYLMGEREHPNDLMAWNADTTRLPARMHREYLTSLYLNNALASSAYQVRGRGVSLSDIRMPVFMVGTQRDHVSPWQSVYKLHHLCDAEITFVLTSGGHNAGIISEPGHKNRSYQMQTRAAHSAWVGHQEWAQQAPRFEGSWWPAWQQWLAAHSGRKVAARPIPAKAVLCDAPGTYVLQRYQD
ncbi:alpha/beta fold hydrolase [Rhodoferax sp.]|uniref:PHA/PHB synthase family protein n=1 Tax=Rhodoferax sp. TaxID=50421 RepID=UPI00260B6D31|nr:alpha/beta fold hydrolase [Rhodoferax sp.]MDD2924437.1 alpha/beta fold hydrolase [Rhodoferax sp.]